MATKGERTRAEIIRLSAELMNREGFLAAPLSAVIAATGIQKGGLYRHFDSREALASEALDFAVAQVRDRLLRAIADQQHACDRLLAMLDAYGDTPAELPLPGGCPIMNSAIESDHAHPALRGRARAAMSAWQGLLVRIIDSGVRAGEIRAGTDPQEVASVFIACIEGAVMLTQLDDDPSHWRAARRHLRAHVDRELRPPAKGEPG
jgi:TetR/AcrR family transcriptional regulator, transcriptional repressor for nem operon